MKVGLLLHGLTHAPAAGRHSTRKREDSSDGVDSFATMLKNAELQPHQRRAAVFGFRELGVLGIPGAQVATSPVNGNEKSVPQRVDAVGDPTNPEGETERSEPGSVNAAIQKEGENEAADTQAAGLSLARSGDEAPSIFSAEIANVPAGPLEIIASVEDLDIGETRAAVPQSTKQVPAQRALNSVAVTVTGANDALTVTVRAEASSVGTQLELRRVLDSVSSEFGVQIAEFQLNGSGSDRATRATNGGTHARHTG